MILGRLVRNGWAVRVGRGRYQLVRSIVAHSDAVNGWSEKTHPKTVRNVLRIILSALDASLGERLVSVALFGSFARGTARAGSDLDVLVVVDRYLSMEEETAVAMATRAACTELLVSQWRSSPTHATPQLQFVSREAADQGSSFLLDLAREAILVYDRGDFLRGALTRLSRRAVALGVRRRTLPGGRWFWAMPNRVPLSALSSRV